MDGDDPSADGGLPLAVVEFVTLRGSHRPTGADTDEEVIRGILAELRDQLPTAAVPSRLIILKSGAIPTDHPQNHPNKSQWQDRSSGIASVAARPLQRHTWCCPRSDTVHAPRLALDIVWPRGRHRGSGSRRVAGASWTRDSDGTRIFRHVCCAWRGQHPASRCHRRLAPANRLSGVAEPSTVCGAAYCWVARRGACSHAGISIWSRVCMLKYAGLSNLTR
jgi:hypothetical protein